LSGDLFEVDLSFGMHLSKDHTDGVLDSTLTSDFGVGILSETSIQDRVRNIITQLVGVTAGYVFRGEEEMAWLYLVNHG
jgi:hypothetical protein